MLPEAIRVRADDPTDKLSTMSRIHYGKLYTVEHNLKVRNFGIIHQDSQGTLTRNLRAVMVNMFSPPSTAGSSSAPTMINAQASVASTRSPNEQQVPLAQSPPRAMVLPGQNQRGKAPVYAQTTPQAQGPQMITRSPTQGFAITKSAFQELQQQPQLFTSAPARTSYVGRPTHTSSTAKQVPAQPLAAGEAEESEGTNDPDETDESEEEDESDETDASNEPEQATAT